MQNQSSQMIAACVEDRAVTSMESKPQATQPNKPMESENARSVEESQVRDTHLRHNYNEWYFDNKMLNQWQCLQATSVFGTRKTSTQKYDKSHKKVMWTEFEWHISMWIRLAKECKCAMITQLGGICKRSAATCWHIDKWSWVAASSNPF